MGIAGWGEPILEGKSRTVAAAVHEMEPYLVGRDPDHIEDIWQTLYRGGFYRGGPILMSAMAGIDQALWDLKGKRYGVPVYQLLGGPARDSVRVYAWIGGDSGEQLREAVLRRQEQGYTAVKMTATEWTHYVDSAATIDEAVSRVGAVREAAGRQMDVAVDFHGRVHRPMAKTLARELEPFRPVFIEEPVLPEHNEVLRELAHHTSIPIATGERMFSRWDFKTILAEGYVDIIQPDLSHAGGISEVRKIASMAEAFDVAVAPHCPLGPIAFAASIQIDAVSPNAFIQEQVLGIHSPHASEAPAYLANPDVFRYEDGFVRLPEGPGLGIEINEVAVREAARNAPSWRSELWRNRDGTVAEW